VSEHEVHIDPVDVVVAVSAGLVGAAGVATRRAGAVLEPLAGTVLQPRWLPRRLQPGRWLEEMDRQGQARRASLAAALGRRLDVLVPVVLTELLRRADLTDLVIRYVDLDDVVRRVDVAAVVDRVDVDPVVARVDLDAAAQRLDHDAVIARLDLTSIVLERVDLDRVVGAVLDRIDLIGLAAEVIDGVDLPEIIRESTGSMASDTVQGVRMQAIGADEALGRAVDRLLLRRRARSTVVPAQRDRSGG
jgi:hypothetical protein